jgi:hypothetical protein
MTEDGASSLEAQRNSWFLMKCQALLDCIPTDGRVLASQFPSVESIPQLGAATLVTLVCAKYATGDTIDKITHDLVSSGDIEGDPHRIQDLLVRPACDAYRARNLPFECWWDPMAIFACMISYYISKSIEQQGSAFDPQHLPKFFLCAAEHSIAGIVARPQTDYSDDALSLLETSPSDSVEQRIVSLASDIAIQEIVDGEMRKRYLLHDRPDLERILRVTETLRAVSRRIQSQEPAETRPALIGRLQRTFDKLKFTLDTLSPLELQMLTECSEYGALACKIANSTKLLIELDGKRPFAVPEFVQGQSEIPSWLYDYVFTQGGRILHKTSGAIPSLIAVSDDPLGWHNVLAIGVSPLSQEGATYLFPVTANPATDPLCFNFVYLADLASHVYDLLFMLLAGGARLDLLRISSSHDLSLVKSIWVPLTDEWISNATQLLETQDLFASGTDFRNVLIADRVGITPDDVVVACENAKSESMFLDFLEFDQTKNQASNELWAAYCDARRYMLDLRAASARRHVAAQPDDKTAWLETALPVATSEYTKHVERIRAKTSRFTWRERGAAAAVASISQGLGPDRCLVHLTMVSTYVEVCYVYLETERHISGRIPAHDLDLAHRDEMSLKVF